MSSASPSQCRQALSQLLQMQLAKVDEVNHYLVELKDSIAQNDIEAINGTLSQNNLPIGEIEDLENHRNQLLTQYGFETNKEGQAACIKWCDDNEGKLSKQYQLLSESLIQLQQSIQINALLVNKGQDRIRRSVSLLTGQVNSEKSNTYSKNGQTHGATNKRSISQA
jgi:flagellar biosynthesis/type III secretory pathway chaperone